MNKTTGIIVACIVLAGIVGGVYASMRNNNEAMVEKKDEGVMMAEKDVMKKDEDMNATKTNDQMMKEETMDQPKNEVMMKSGSYEVYSSEKIAMAETGKVVLFFHASWCPSCRALNTDIESNVKSIPEEVTILKTDYDKEVVLKKKYGVTTQHTLVQVDADGNLIKKWSGGGSLSTVLSQIQ